MKTATVGELIELLAKYPHDTPVMAEWEGQYMPIPARLELKSTEGRFNDAGRDVLMIDADGYDFT